MKPGFLRNLILALLLLGVFTVLLTKSRMVDSDEHYRYLRTLHVLQELEVATNEIILRTRHAYLGSYDPLVKVVDKLRQTACQLDRLPSFLTEGERQDIRSLRDAYQVMHAQRFELIERFKSDNAVLHNSLSFFPIAVSEMAARAAESGQAQLATQLRDMQRDILMYNLYAYPEILERLQAQLVRLEAETAGRGGPLDRVNMARNLRHAGVILKYKQQLDQTTMRSLQLPAAATIWKVEHRYQQAYRRAIGTSNHYRLALYLVGIALAAGIAYAMIYRYNAGMALRRANEILEKEVHTRTEELRQSNALLLEQKNHLDQSLEQLRQAQDELERLAMTDELTGLYTRRFLFEWLDTHLADSRRKKRRLSCLMLDVDFFKRINDTHGHPVGDQVLRQVAATIRKNVREGDVCGRFGGEEFLVLLPETALVNGLTVAEKIRLAVATIKEPVPVTISIGVAECASWLHGPAAEDTRKMADTLLQAADNALYEAKEQGRNRVCAAQEDTPESGDPPS